ncbi:MAG: substrate-binding domain-containing protein [Armatimonadetes bacterium]|nr:substrate-binding domain-containing protein [Armatimonadota bacterium]
MAVLALSLIGCNNGGSTDSTSSSSTATSSNGSTDSGKKCKIAFIPKGSTHEFWKTMQAGAEEAAAANNVELLWKAPLKEDDKAEQVKVVENFTAEKVDGMILAPLDDEALRSPTQDAIDAGIPVIIVDSGLKDVKTESFIATDNEKAGYMGGQQLAKELGGKGDVIMLRYAVGSASTMAREKGFLDAAKAGGLNVVSENQYGGATRESAQSASENLLAQFKKGDGLNIQGIFCPNESTTFGMLRALQNAKLAGKVKFVGFDSSKELLDAIRVGQLDGLVLQNPALMGKLAIENMVKKLKGGTPEARIDTGATMVDKTNIDSDDVKKILPKSQ